MDLSGKPNIGLTAPEAAWIGNNPKLPQGIRLRAIQARRDAIAPFVSEGLFRGIPLLVNRPELVGDNELFVRYIQADEAMVNAEHTHGRDAAKNQLHLVKMTLEPEEITGIYLAAIEARDWLDSEIGQPDYRPGDSGGDSELARPPHDITFFEGDMSETFAVEGIIRAFEGQQGTDT